MRLDKLTANVRPIPAHEAIELGLMMARVWYGRLFGVWIGHVLSFGVMLLMASVVFDYLYTDRFLRVQALIGFFGLMYIFKPLFEIPLVLFLSKRLFDGEFDGDLTYKLTPRVLLDLCLRYRLSIQRPLVMAVYLLEGQRGKDLSSRVSVLSRGCGNVLANHTAAFFVVEWLLYITAGGLLTQQVISNPLSTTIVQRSANSDWQDVVFVVLAMLAQGMIAVFFVSSGFALYVCRRSLLEGWDIELKFRRLAERFLEQKNRQVNQ